MRKAAFPGCCTAYIIHDFGGSQLCAFRQSRRTKKEMRAYLQTKINDAEGRYCLVAMTNDDQTSANAVLKELGFKSSKWMEKEQHPESKLKLWWKEP